MREVLSLYLNRCFNVRSGKLYNSINDRLSELLLNWFGRHCERISQHHSNSSKIISRGLFNIAPILTRADFGDDGDGELGYGFHLLFD